MRKLKWKGAQGTLGTQGDRDEKVAQERKLQEEKAKFDKEVVKNKRRKNSKRFQSLLDRHWSHCLPLKQDRDLTKLFKIG